MHARTSQSHPLQIDSRGHVGRGQLAHVLSGQVRPQRPDRRLGPGSRQRPARSSRLGPKHVRDADGDARSGTAADTEPWRACLAHGPSLVAPADRGWRCTRRALRTRLDRGRRGPAPSVAGGGGDRSPPPRWVGSHGHRRSQAPYRLRRGARERAVSGTPCADGNGREPASGALRLWIVGGSGHLQNIFCAEHDWPIKTPREVLGRARSGWSVLATVARVYVTC